MKVMVCLRFTSLFLVIFLSLLAQGQGIQASNNEEMQVKKMGMGGRKLGAVQKEMVEGDHEGLMNTGANPSDEKCDHGVKGKLNIKCELSDDRGLPSSVKLVVGLIPLNSDYRKSKSSSENLFGSTTSNKIAKDKYSRGSSMKPVEATETQLSSQVLSKTSSTHCNETPRPKAPIDRPFETMNSDKLLRATREILNMMNKDYQKKARSRPPINNRHIPLEKP